jgi:hypothetical protein
MPLLDCQISEFIDSPEFRLEPSMTQLALLRRALEITPPIASMLSSMCPRRSLGSLIRPDSARTSDP